MTAEPQDTALQNAKAKRYGVRMKILEINAQINRLIEERAALVPEYEKAEAFIDTWYEMAGIPNPKFAEQKETARKPQRPVVVEKRPPNPNRRDVTLKAVEYIREAERPLSRAEIYQQLLGDGIVIHGKDPQMVLSTMLWRTKDIIRRLRGGGYWPVGDPLPAGYAEDFEDLLS
jgi:hypothetical protein